MFRGLIPHLLTNYVKQVKLYDVIFDDDVNDVNGLLRDFVCEKLVIGRWCKVTTTQLADILVNRHVDNVVIINNNDVDVNYLRKLYPHITFNN